MPGYGTDEVRLVNEDEKERLLCSKCRLLLRDALQKTETGARYCSSCASSNDEEDRPDRAVDREIAALMVHCTNKNEGCPWEGTLGQFQKEHFPGCQKQSKATLKAENRKLSQENKKLQKEICTLKEQLSTQRMPRPYSSCATVDYFLSPSEDCEGVEGLSLETPLAVTVHIKIGSGPPEDDPKSECKTSQSAPRDQSPEDFDELYALAQEGLSEVETRAEKGRKEIACLKEGTELSSRGLKAVAHQIALRGTPSEIPSKLLLNTSQTSFNAYMEGTSPCKGHFMRCCWTISRACKQSNVPLVSPEWLTHPLGYQMKAILYPSGFGHFSGSHFSVFMFVVRGPYDDLLRWPVNGTLSFFLVDTKRKNAIPWVRSRRSDPENSPFQRPQELSDRIVASGCPDFIPLTKLGECYVKDNTVMIEFTFRPEL